VPPDGWEAHNNGTHYRQPGGEWTTTMPAGTRPLGIIALADAIPGMGAMTSLDLSSNQIGAEGATYVAEAIKVSVCVCMCVYVWGWVGVGGGGVGPTNH
jgi:hypothetical protein